MTVKWIKKEVAGGNDGIAQVRSDYPTGAKLGDLTDATPILLPDPSVMTAAEKSTYISSDGLWSQCKNESGGLFFPNPSGKNENWFELANSRPATVIPPVDGEKTVSVTGIKLTLSPLALEVTFKEKS
jgi:hypothetical protein